MLVPTACPPSPRPELTVGAGAAGTGSRARGGYTLCDHNGTPRAFLRLGWSLRYGEICAGDMIYPVRERGWRHVSAGDPDEPVVRLSPYDVRVRGNGSEPSWKVTRDIRTYTATLARDGARITVRLHGHHVDAEISGAWERPDVVALTACFALLARRRRFLVIISGGSH